jgi:hypothetical protein
MKKNPFTRGATFNLWEGGNSMPIQTSNITSVEESPSSQMNMTQQQ